MKKQNKGGSAKEGWRHFPPLAAINPGDNGFWTPKTLQPSKTFASPDKKYFEKFWQQKTFAFVQTDSYATYPNQFLMSVLLYCCIVMDMRSTLYRKVHIIMYELPDLCLIQQHRCLDRGFPKTKLCWDSQIDTIASVVSSVDIPM